MGKSTISMAISTISMAIFNSYVSLPEGKHTKKWKITFINGKINNFYGHFNNFYGHFQ